MKPISKYEFKMNSASRYAFVSCVGADFLPLPVWKKGENKGKRYIQFEHQTIPPRPNHRYFEWVFSLDKKENGSSRRLTGVNFSLTYPNKTFGDNKNIGGSDAILFEFSENRENLTMWIFKNQADNSETLFNKWTAGQLCMSVDIIPITQN